MLKSRYAFYCGQSYMDAKDIDKAIEWNKIRLTLDGYVQEKFVACIRLGAFFESKRDLATAANYYLQSIAFDSNRIEGLSHAVRMLTLNGLYHLAKVVYKQYEDHTFAITESKIFLDMSQYDFSHTFYFSVAAALANDVKSAFLASRVLLDKEQLPVGKSVQNVINMSLMTEAWQSMDTMSTLAVIKEVSAAKERVTKRVENELAWVDCQQLVESIDISWQRIMQYGRDKMQAFAPFRMQLLEPPHDMMVCVMCAESLDTLKSMSYTWIDLFKARQLVIIISKQLASRESIDQVAKAFPRARIMVPPFGLSDLQGMY
jgi:tetratricopeptide (TPR) repeat protein